MITFRAMRHVNVVHAEAFQLMLYQPKGKAAIGPDLWIWNSRDGVTPFGARHVDLDYLHAMNAYRPTYWGAIPDAATHVWIDYDQSSWAELMSRKFNVRHAADDEISADFRDRFPTLEKWLTVVPFSAGQPKMVTREEFLASTSCFMAQYADHLGKVP